MSLLGTGRPARLPITGNRQQKYKQVVTARNAWQDGVEDEDIDVLLYDALAAVGEMQEMNVLSSRLVSMLPAAPIATICVRGTRWPHSS